MDKIFTDWFVEEQIHEVITNRSQLLAEYLPNFQAYDSDIEDTHNRIVRFLVYRAYELGKNSVS